MKEIKDQKKRLVSKNQYARYIGKKATHLSFGSFVVLVGYVGMSLTLLILVVGFYTLIRAGLISGIFSSAKFFFLSVFIGGMSLFAIRAGKREMQEASKMEPVELMTRDNIDLLPVEDVLVRGSAEPIQAQKDVLLRAAQIASETPAEELLRPHTM